MNVLLSIKPEFAFQIFSRTKRFEYRRVIFREEVKRIVVYASSPIQMVIGEFCVKQILFEEIDDLWSRTHRYSGITKQYFYSYFYDKDRGYAIQVGNVIRYHKPKSLQASYGISPPQSFAYIYSSP
ncbi:MAG: hypothetical protein QOC96_889 [Acidobacteriota bacterium]|jgi:predicted transcriptional regulator|nr:hypothetical protein [Acidobacteriota bacterium]